MDRFKIGFVTMSVISLVLVVLCVMIANAENGYTYELSSLMISACSCIVSALAFIVIVAMWSDSVKSK